MTPTPKAWLRVIAIIRLSLAKRVQVPCPLGKQRAKRFGLDFYLPAIGIFLIVELVEFTYIYYRGSDHEKVQQQLELKNQS